ncbi:Hypothetical protein PP7435_CHR3-0166 [Komagataella phaffii CBS 7435]|nr:Hypothetical protein BQ9382_C3-0946 [Komagataella phaffii CBS 7435]CCA39138.1 Hypothetical protein PP7435_CHR3-0166 [Komagataella phaffii CBS 7435]
MNLFQPIITRYGICRLMGQVDKLLREKLLRRSRKNELEYMIKHLSQFPMLLLLRWNEGNLKLRDNMWFELNDKLQQENRQYNQKINPLILEFIDPNLRLVLFEQIRFETRLERDLGYFMNSTSPKKPTNEGLSISEILGKDVDTTKGVKTPGKDHFTYLPSFVIGVGDLGLSSFDTLLEILEKFSNKLSLLAVRLSMLNRGTYTNHDLAISLKRIQESMGSTAAEDDQYTKLLSIARRSHIKQDEMEHSLQRLGELGLLNVKKGEEGLLFVTR